MLSYIISQTQSNRNQYNIRRQRRRRMPFQLTNTRNTNEPNLTETHNESIAESHTPSFIDLENQYLPIFTATLEEHYDATYEFDTLFQYIYEEIHNEEEEKTNDEKTSRLIKENSKKACYSDVKEKILNDTCPILMTPFQKNSIIHYFKCFHAIDESVMDSFTIHFLKCPLCNRNIN